MSTRAPIAPRNPPRSAGFTTIELVVVIVLLGILAAAVLPKLSDTATFRQAAFRDEVVAALRYAQKSAVSHRRLVCATFTATTVTLTIAAANPAAACGTAILQAPDGGSAYASSRDPDHATVAVVGPIHFQPSGAATADAGGSSVTDYSIAVAGMTPVTVQGATGYVN